MSNESTVIRKFATAAETLLPHQFQVIDALDDKTPIPMEALSEDHTIGIYSSVTPRKMREHQTSYSRVDVSHFSLQTHVTPHPTGVRYESYLEYPPLRGVRFRVEDLQYLEQGWWSALPEVKYPTNTVLMLLHLVMETHGRAFLYLNRTMPMPLWIRANPMEEDDSSVQFAIQARALNRLRPTNIHTEVSMDYARRWADGVRDFFDVLTEAE